MDNLSSEIEVKCIVWDLDNTIWNGVLSESVDVKLKDGIYDIIKELDSRGILHSIASKNNFEDAKNKLKEFDLDKFFIYPEIHWNPKSDSIANIQKNLNFGMNTILFIDDQPFEREEVNFVHKEIECLDAVFYKDLLGHKRLNPRFITVDSKKRRAMYIADIERKRVESDFVGTSESFLSSLGMKFKISKAEEEDLKRVEELTVRTNQLNATGITYDYDELNYFRKSKDYFLLVCELTDKYGSYGKIGIALVETKGDIWHIKLLLMSCRVMSRGVGTVLLTYILQEAKKSNKRVLADFKKTNRNKQMYIAYKFANFKELKKDGDMIVLENDLNYLHPYPNYIDLEIINSEVKECV